MEILSNIPEEVLEVMSRASIDGNCLKLSGQLDRKIYVTVNKVLEQLGGKWNRKQAGHIFAENPQAKLDALLNSGQIAYDNKNGFFETPDSVIDRMIELADLKEGLFILEPSAGKGAIAEKVRALNLDTSVYCVEQNAERAAVLRDKLFVVSEVPFEEYQPEFLFDRSLMNPPFQNSLDARHILRAYGMLKPEGVLVSVASAGMRFRTEKVYEEVRGLLNHIEDLPDDSFKDSGTRVKTCLLRIEK